jgi:ABC-type Fe3+-hydroxamate transport system substrate-binding protein
MRDSLTALDDLGAPVRVLGPAQRVVSLVPSLTEAVAASRPGALVAATEWCTHPADLDVARIRGTKNPDWRAIVDLQPDLVIANQEENRELDVQRLREAGVPVWVTRIESVDESLASMRRMFEEALRWPVPAWLDEAVHVWSAPPSLEGMRVATAVWRDPWMVVGRDTFTGDLLTRLGCDHVLADHAERYPQIAVDELDAMGLDLILLPDEPYAFSASDGPEAFATTPTTLVEGRMLTWYGPSLVTARAELGAALLVGQPVAVTAPQPAQPLDGQPVVSAGLDTDPSRSR